jgi:hypothetical protein
MMTLKSFWMKSLQFKEPSKWHNMSYECKIHLSRAPLLTYTTIYITTYTRHNTKIP